MTTLFFLSHRTDEERREDRKHHHTTETHQHTEDLAWHTGGNNIRAYGGKVHGRPPQRVGVISYGRVHPVFVVKEQERREINYA